MGSTWADLSYLDIGPFPHSIRIANWWYTWVMDCSLNLQLKMAVRLDWYPPLPLPPSLTCHADSFAFICKGCESQLGHCYTYRILHVVLNASKKIHSYIRRCLESLWKVLRCVGVYMGWTSADKDLGVSRKLNVLFEKVWVVDQSFII